MIGELPPGIDPLAAPGWLWAASWPLELACARPSNALMPVATPPLPFYEASNGKPLSGAPRPFIFTYVLMNAHLLAILGEQMRGKRMARSGVTCVTQACHTQSVTVNRGTLDHLGERNAEDWAGWARLEH